MILELNRLNLLFIIWAFESRVAKRLQKKRGKTKSKSKSKSKSKGFDTKFKKELKSLQLLSKCSFVVHYLLCHVLLKFYYNPCYKIWLNFTFVSRYKNWVCLNLCTLKRSLGSVGEGLELFILKVKISLINQFRLILFRLIFAFQNVRNAFLQITKSNRNHSCNLFRLAMCLKSVHLNFSILVFFQITEIVSLLSWAAANIH